ncbi:hypothetical protein [Gilvimarinus chinensis]|uniref:hypothetical protein n=1 Tax=Gilvimarinus chinensis TaxID=396005 RepID=UPI000371CDCE|nr:hypothetical protein [Gilvimarinus chinensis]
MKKEVDIKEFEDDYEPAGELVSFEHQPVVLKFPPAAYRPVEPEELKEWRAEVADRLGLDFDIGPNSGGTISFCRRGGTGAAYRCDSDISQAPDFAEEAPVKGRLTAWDASPVVLNFPPAAYEVVVPERMKEWHAEVKERLGLDFDIGGGSGGTVSFCKRGGTGAAYRCDCDMG